jgi:hypothetical protein
MPDFGFVGPSYEAPSIYQDAQECINFFPEVDYLKQAGDRGVVALYPTPGLTTQAILPNFQEVRGMRTLSGGNQMVAVCGPYVYVLTANLVPEVIGFLNTSSGRVGISDNGVNAYFVDGAYRYTWRINSPNQAVFVGSISGTTLTVTAVSSGTIGINQQVFGVGLTGETIITALGSGSGGVGTYTVNNSQTVAAETLNSSVIGTRFQGTIAGSVLTVTSVTAGSIYLGQTVQGAGVPANTVILSYGTGGGGLGTYNISSTATITTPETMYGLDFSVLPSTDGAFSGGTSVDIVDNYFVYSRPNSQWWGASDLLSPISPQASYSLKDGAPDNLVALIVDHREVYLMGEQSSEVWNDVGAVPFPFQRIPGTSTQHGIAAPNSLARVGNSFAFVSRNNRGQAEIMQMSGYIPQRISTHAVENTLVNQVINDAVAWTYQLEGHEIYVITFPSIGPNGLTWAYDSTTNMWHKWMYWTTVYERHRGNCCAVFQNMVLVGDYANGKIYMLDKTNFTDDGNTIRRLRRAPHLVSDLQRQYFEELQIQFQPGVGTTGLFINNPTYSSNPTVITIAPDQLLTIGPNDTLIIGFNSQQNTQQTTNPQAMLRWSNDGGSTWSNEHWVSMGQLGKYKNRAIWRRLGWSRDRVFEVVVTDPVNAVIVSANLKAKVGAN